MTDSKTARVFLVRHGEVAANRVFAFVGRGEDPLTSTGLEQADGLASFFAALPIDRVVSSPLHRCLSTAEAIASTTGVDVVADRRIIEQSFGQWEGRTRVEVEAMGSESREQMRAWRLDPSRRPPGGESLVEVQERALSLVQDLVTRESGSVVLISHVGPIKAILCHALGLPLSMVGRFFLDPASISVVDWGSPPVLRVFNAHTEMGWQHARWLGKS